MRIPSLQKRRIASLCRRHDILDVPFNFIGRHCVAFVSLYVDFKGAVWQVRRCYFKENLELRKLMKDSNQT